MLVIEISSGRKFSEIEKGKMDVFIIHIFNFNNLPQEILDCTNKLISSDYLCLNFEILKNYKPIVRITNIRR